MNRQFYISHFTDVRKDTLAVLNAFCDADLTFIPITGGWTAGRIMLHIGSAANFWLHSGILSPVNVYIHDLATLTNYPTLELIREFLDEEHKNTIDLLNNFDSQNWDKPYPYQDGYTYTPAWIFWHVLEHEIHHRGELSLILGLLGREGLQV